MTPGIDQLTQTDIVLRPADTCDKNRKCTRCSKMTTSLLPEQRVSNIYG